MPRKPTDYDRAISLLSDLRDLAQGGETVGRISARVSTHSETLT